MRPPSTPQFRHPAVAIAILAAALVSGCAPAPLDTQDTASERIHIAASLPPQAWLADRVGGERVTTSILLPPGRSHHTFEPAPREILALGTARLFLAVDHPSLPFEGALLDSLPSESRPEVVPWSAAVPAGKILSVDPHFWLDPDVMSAAATATAEALARLDPDNTSLYHDNLRAVTSEIAAVDDDLRALLAPVRGATVVVYHPAWRPLLARYGLAEQALEHEGKPPSPRQLARRIEAARAQGVTTVFSQPGLPEHATRTLAGEIGARVVELDPLAYAWATNLRYAGRAFAAAAVPVEESPESPER